MSIAVAHNETKEGTAALLRAADQAALQDTDLIVVHVFEGHQGATGSPEEQAIHDGISHTLAQSAAPQVQWHLRTTSGTHDTAGAILDLVAETGAEMLVVGSKRRSPIGKFLMGSTVQRLVLDTPVPVLIVKAATA